MQALHRAPLGRYTFVVLQASRTYAATESSDSCSLLFCVVERDFAAMTLEQLVFSQRNIIGYAMIGG
jgi:hypothetical protein